MLAGRTDGANDRLSLKLARPNDWWFHVRSLPGSHVLLLSREGEEPSRDTLKQAAAVAAFHSKARSGGGHSGLLHPGQIRFQGPGAQTGNCSYPQRDGNQGSPGHSNP